MKLRIFVEPQQGATYDTILGVAQEAERQGFDAFFRSDHYLAMGGGDGLPGPTDAWITLAGLARETSTIRLGTLVSSATFRHPGVLAISVAQVDQMSGGRVELGLGTGWYDGEHTAYGIPFPALGERFAILEEQLAVLSGLWSTPVGETFSFTGAHITVADSPALPKATQADPTSGGVPILIGGGGRKKTPALAARYGAEYNLPFFPVKAVGGAFDRATAACEAVDRDPATLVRSAAVVVCCGADDAEVARRAAAIGREVDELKENGACGSPAEVLEKLAAYAEAGAERLYLQVMDMADVDHVALLGTEVLPHA